MTEAPQPGRGASPAEAAYLDLLESIGRSAGAIGDRPLASHWPHVGTVASGLVIAGQALQGWDHAVTGARWRPADAVTARGRRRILRDSQTWFAGAPEPVGVIATLGNRSGSPFWDLSRSLVESLEPDRAPWYARYAWANVYPVSFDGVDGHRADSPKGPLMEAQDPHVGRLFGALMDELGARRVIVISGPSYWRHAATDPDLRALPAATFPLIRAGRVGRRTWVVGYHPTYARRRSVTAATYRDAILRAVEDAEGP